MSLILRITNIYAQTAYTEIKPSVNAQQFISAASSNTNLQTGQLSTSIPLFNLQGKGINLPISIAFSGTGVTHESEASHIGLGWSLLAGGVITRTVRGNPDPASSTPQDLPWQYDENFLQNKWYEESNDIYSTNKFDIAMDAVIDGEPDVYSYSFLGYSGDICFKYNTDGSVSRTLYPDKSFRISKTTLGYKIIANDGVEYLFETTEEKAFSVTNHTTSWFLTEIKTLQGGTVTFQYAEEKSYDLTQPGGTVGSYMTCTSKRLTRIDYDYGYVTFSHGGRNDFYYNGIVDPKRITDIRLYDTEDVLIKGYELSNNSYMLNDNVNSTTWQSRRLKLNSIREFNHNGEYLPPYEFEYDYYFGLSKNSSVPSNPFPVPKNTWALNPTALAVMDRSITNGNLFLWVVQECYPVPPAGEQCISYPMGYNTTTDTGDGFTIHDFLSLTKIEFPTGGSELYYYEPHDYGFISTSTDTIKPPYYSGSQIMGKRLWKKEIAEGNGNTQIVEYKYCLHDENYERIDGDYFAAPIPISSGVLVNPSIHTSTMYAPLYDYSRPRLGASPYNTVTPQNTSSGSPVYYTEVEEIFKKGSGETNGKKIYYFEEMYAIPSTNYVYLNYNKDVGPVTMANRLLNLPNTIYGKQTYPPDPEISGLSNQNFTYLAYPVGRFYHSDLRKGILLHEIVLNANGDLVRKIDNEYTPGDGIESTLYGLVFQKFNDNDYTANPNPAFDVNRYLISQSKITFGLRQLLKRTITNYHLSNSITEEQNFIYTNLNLLKSTTMTSSKGENIVSENVYPTEIIFQTVSNLSVHAASIKTMKDINVIGIPVQTTTKRGTEYIGGNYTTFKQLPGGAVVVDNVFSLEPQPGVSVSNPVVNASGQVEKNSNFISDVTYLSYNDDGNLTTKVSRNGITETLVWGYEGHYPIAKIEDYTYDQVTGNSALLSQLELLDDYTVITNSNLASLSTCNQAIRNSLPAHVRITTYTYDPLVGVTSQTDFSGQTTFYQYDNFRRLHLVSDYEGNIVKEYKYNYKD